MEVGIAMSPENKLSPFSSQKKLSLFSSQFEEPKINSYFFLFNFKSICHGPSFLIFLLAIVLIHENVTLKKNLSKISFVIFVL